MNYLAIDTSGEKLSVVVSYDNLIYSQTDDDSMTKHSVTLLPTVEALLERAGAKLSDMEIVALTVGPGSFTGIRIGVATAKGLSVAMSVPCLAVTTFDALAYAVSEGKRLAVIDARHDNYYIQGYDGDNVCLEAAFIDKNELTKLSKDYTLLSASKLEGFDSIIVDISVGLQSAVEKKSAFATLDMTKIAPFYLRLSQAEEGRK